MFGFPRDLRQTVRVSARRTSGFRGSHFHETPWGTMITCHFERPYKKRYKIEFIARRDFKEVALAAQVFFLWKEAREVRRKKRSHPQPKPRTELREMNTNSERESRGGVVGVKRTYRATR